MFRLSSGLTPRKNETLSMPARVFTCSTSLAGSAFETNTEAGPVFACTTPPAADTDTLSAPGVPFTITVSTHRAAAGDVAEVGVDAGDVGAGERVDGELVGAAE